MDAERGSKTENAKDRGAERDETEERRVANRRRFTKHRVPREREGKREKGRHAQRGNRDKKHVTRPDDLSCCRIVDRDAYGFPAWRVNTRTDKGSHVIYEGTSS